MLMVSLTLLIAGVALAQEHAMGQNVAEMKLRTVPGLPTCATGAVQSGDPTKGPSIIYSKMTAGCTIPWHWHTPNEHLMMVTGTARMDMKNGQPLTLRAGGFAMMPSHHVHQFSCAKGCTLYIYSDGPFDIHYVNAGGARSHRPTR